MEGRAARERDSVALDLVGVAGLTGLLLGLTWLQASDKLGFDPAGALDGVLGQLAITLPAALLVLGATVLELAAGLVLARALRRTPFDSLAEALLAAMVAAVLKDTVLLGTLGAFGLFLAPVLIVIDVAIIAAGLGLSQLAGQTRPLTAFGSWREALHSIPSIPPAALVAIVWAGPVVLQLASPVVPFVDVLPNYVGPVEHLRTFGWFSPLTATQSPIIGPSRTVLGYDGLLGSLATITDLPGALAIAGFILPQTILVAAGAQRLARALGGREVSIGLWALLAFALSQSFARLADARGTVIVVPLVCVGLALAADCLDRRPEQRGDRAEDPWRVGRGAVMGLALGAATLVHPVIGFFALVTVAITALVRPKALAAEAFVATLTAGLIALPQLGVMIGLSLPTLALGIGLPVAIAISLAVGRLVSGGDATRTTLVRLAGLVRWIALAGLVLAVAGAFAVAALNLGKVPRALGEGTSLVLESSGLLLIVVAIGAALGSPGARSPLVVVGALVGIGAVLVANLLPSNIGFLGDALRFEVPKTVHYWLSTVAAVGAASALAFGWSSERLPLVARGLAVATFVVVAALPLRFGDSGDGLDCAREDCSAINPYHLGEHRYAETLAIDLRYAGSGFWQGFPDSRTVVNAPRQELLAALRLEIEAGWLHHDTGVLHLARSFQQWVATPLGVFDGVTETFVSLDPEVSHQTVGGRLYGFERLAEFLSSGAYPYVVLEPDRLEPDVREQVLGAGYVSIFSNDQGEVFRAGD
ncbi:MAG TPA: hypothetical protein VM451_06265 [Candidatus Limnocylindria bacterium]|nr:hypothetical protein [Candidatus Limnocylindria bacterium]